MSRPVIVIVLLCLCIAILQFFYIQLQTDMLPVDIAYAHLQDQLQQEKKVNMELKDELYSLESFTTIATRAASMGFTMQNTESIFLGSQ